MTMPEVESKLSLLLAIYKHSEKCKERPTADKSMKELMTSQMERMLPEILELQKLFLPKELSTKGLLLDSQKKAKSKAKPSKNVHGHA